MSDNEVTRSRASDGVSEAEQTDYERGYVQGCNDAVAFKIGASQPDAPITPESMSLLEHHCSDADFATIGKLRDESYAAGYSAGRDDAARLNVQEGEYAADQRSIIAGVQRDGHTEHCAKRQVYGDGECECVPTPAVHVVQLHEDTVRALVAALSVLWPRDIRQNEGPVETADNLLAKLKETKR